MPPIKIQISADDAGASATIDHINEKLTSLGGGAGGMAGLVKGAADLHGAFSILSASVSDGAGLINNLEQLGTAALRTENAFAAMAGSNADQWMARMMSSTQGLVDDTDLAAAATQALSTGIVSTGKDLEDLTRIGSVLGLTFKGSAAEGIQSLTRDLQMVGSTRGLKELGLDADSVRDKFELLKLTMNDQDAWSGAIFGEGGTQADKFKGGMTGAGTEMDRLKIQWDELVESFSKEVSGGINIELKIMRTIIEDKKDRNATIGDIIKGKMADGSPLNFAEQFYNATGIFPGDLQAEVSGAIDENNGIIRHTSSTFPTRPGERPKTDTSGTAGAGLSEDMLWQYAGAGAMDQIANDKRQQYDRARQDAMWQALAQQKQARALTGPYGGGLSYPGGDDTSGGFTMSQYGGAAQAGRDQAEGVRSLQGLVTGLGDRWLDVYGAIQKGVGAIQDQAAAAKNFQSVGEAFGLTGGGIAGEIGGQLGGDAANARKGIYGAKAQAAFDAETKKVMDEYAIATGQATKESIAFADAQASLSKQFTSGKISFKEEADGMLALAQAASTGANSIEQIYSIMIKTNNLKAPVWWTELYGPGLQGENADEMSGLKGGHKGMYGLSEEGDGKGGAKTQASTADPYGSVKNSAKAAMDMVDKLPGVAAAVSLALQTHGKTAADGLSPIIREASAAASAVSGIRSALMGLTGSLTINVSFAGSGQNGGGAPVGMHQGS